MTLLQKAKIMRLIDKGLLQCDCKEFKATHVDRAGEPECDRCRDWNAVAFEENEKWQIECRRSER